MWPNARVQPRIRAQREFVGWNTLLCGERSFRLINHLNGLFLDFSCNLK
jgi:hypothetical protein